MSRALRWPHRQHAIGSVGEATQPLRDRPSNRFFTRALAHEEREVRKDVLRVEVEFAAHPRTRRHEGDGDRDELHREAERLLLDLREGLQERDEDADHRRHDDRDERELQDEDQALLGVEDELRVAHGVSPPRGCRTARAPG